LGISLYSSLPPVIAEMVANSFDANAKSVIIYINDLPTKNIIISDDGDGMTYDDLRTKYLEIGRDKRSEQLKLNFGRQPIGKKGIGKLSGFGIAKVIEIDTTCCNVRNTIELDYEQIINKKDGKYSPNIINDNAEVKNNHGTVIKLGNLKRKTSFSQEYIENLAYDLSKRFSLFDENFKVQIVYNNDLDNKIPVSNEMKYDNIDAEFTWDIPNEEFNDDYEYCKQVVGKIIATKGPAPKNLKGIILLSRKKLVNQKEFYDADNQDYAFTHLTGYLNVDFIELFPEDPISTNRESLNWELEETIKLRSYLTRLITKVKDEWREKRRIEKLKNIKRESGIDVDDWISSMHSKHEQQLARKIINSILSSSNIDTAKAGEIVKYIRNSFEFESFKHYATEMASLDHIDGGALINLIKEWEIIEAREIYHLAKVRIEAIKTFEKHIDRNALEVKVIEPFFEKFPWILDPRIMSFKTEKRYSQLLKENFPEDKHTVESDKRIDFLCTNHIGHHFIIELKRPKSIITSKQLQQGLEYVSFLKSIVGTEFSSMVYCIVVGGAASEKGVDKEMMDSLKGKVYFKSYEEVLSQAKNYHQEIIDRYDKMTNFYG
jgi:hypothetical protein